MSMENNMESKNKTHPMMIPWHLDIWNSMAYGNWWQEMNTNEGMDIRTFYNQKSKNNSLTLTVI